MQNKHVLYFYCTPYKKASAGVVTIHKIIDYFNRNNQPAYILVQNESIGAEGYNLSSESKLKTPLLTENILNKHVSENKTPIIFYPDTVSENIFASENSCRMILYYDGILTGRSSLDSVEKEGIIFFSKLIKDRAKLKKSLYEYIVSFPVADSEIISFNTQDSKNIERKDIFYYDGKFTRNFGGKIPKNIKKYKKIDRGLKNSMKQDELFENLKKAKLLHVFEDTALIYEALLLGCPVNIHPSGVFYKNKPLAFYEVKLSGSLSKKIVTKEDINYALNEIHKFKDDYKKWETYGENQLKNFKYNFKYHTGSFNKKNINKIKKNIKYTKNYIRLYEKEINLNTNNKHSYQSIYYFFIKIFYVIYKLLLKNKFFEKYFKYIAIRAYHSLPIGLKHKITNCIRRINS